MQSEMKSDSMAGGDSPERFQSLGLLWILYGAIRLMGAIWLAFFSNTATAMFGALLNRVPDPFSMMSFFHVFYMVLIVLSTLCGVLGILAGLNLTWGQASGRILAIAAAFLSLSEIPVGIALGVYTLIVLLPLHRPGYSVARREAVSNLRGQPSAL